MPWTNSSGGNGSRQRSAVRKGPGAAGPVARRRHASARSRGHAAPQPGPAAPLSARTRLRAPAASSCCCSSSSASGWRRGIYFVGAFEQGIVLRFGKFVARTPPGINYHLPWPIETAYTLDVTRQRQINIGYRTPPTATTTNANTEDMPAEADMLTGDENIIDINFTVFWVVKDAGAYLFNVENPDHDDQGGGRKRDARSGRPQPVRKHPHPGPRSHPDRGQGPDAEDARRLWRGRHHHEREDAEGRSARAR